ncbi:hypothetical protein RHGRI_025189 [Rhododendron griersonianum]|uniref:J domain-containing protein n=1 Tax=Rhododendron griersonianum TaxID=479676 RepID=A0AAV6JCE3_9ERIC|nr:hypothetical protein RHGRI_025189 [Rhododendron griersonianum]
MAAGEERSYDFYAVLGLEKECSAAELRNAYKNLAMRWHPDRCTASGNAEYTEEAKKKFQGIQQAYSVLSDTNKRFLYDVGFYDSDDDQNGMGDFLNEMVDIMCQDECNENGEESFEELQELYEELFQSDIEAFGSTSPIVNHSSCSSSSYASCGESSDASNKRNSSEMYSGRAKNDSGFDAHYEGFCFGAEENPKKRGKAAAAGGIPKGGAVTRQHGRKQKVSSGHDVSSDDYYSSIYT